MPVHPSFMKHRLAGLAGLAAFLIAIAPCPGHGQPPQELTAMIGRLKTDPKGPYAAIRWFCPDGTELPTSSRCPSPGGLQRAVPKPDVALLAATEGIYWGQILAGTPIAAFWDEVNHFSRLKQYQLERYLQRVDDGWIVRQSRYYRGAVQFEDESRWGMAFLEALLADDRMVEAQFFLLRQAARDIPHFADVSHWEAIRSRSQAIADALPAFTPLWIKLHGQPEASDRYRLKAFLTAQQSLDPSLRTEIEGLIQDLDAAFQMANTEQLQAFLPRLSRTAPSRKRLAALIETVPGAEMANRVAHWRELAELLVQIRLEILATSGPGKRLILMDLSNTVEELLFPQMAAWQPATVGELLDKLAIAAGGCAGAGYLEQWEWQQVAPLLAKEGGSTETDLATLTAAADTARRIAEWGSAMVRAHYGEVVGRWQSFEPLAGGFIDDRVRSTLLLSAGDVASRLQAFIASLGPPASQVMGIADTSRIRGLNPGYALGPLRVLGDTGAHQTLVQSDIVVLPHAPTDLKPVAGIASVSEGNLVSHVQLLARNLGIPNTVLSDADLKTLQKFSGQTVFYAVSPGGTVVMKQAMDMTAEERSLVEKRQSDEQRISVPMDRIDLACTTPIGLTDLSAADSGRWCGPKAANLGRLKHLFPDQVVSGLVIPFGAFRQQMDQAMPDTGLTYWQFMQEAFTRSEESALLEQLAILHEAVRRMALLPEFEATIREAFRNLLGVTIDDQAVFVHSDTNMEDLKEFAGAGLNLTVFNVRGESAIFQAIRDVWASAYAERSYRWRQRFMTNAEDVYPSILILPTVDVAKSGVMITTGVAGGEADDLTVTFSRGAGGAVEGQTAETWRLTADGSARLLSPAREPGYTLLPVAGGTAKGTTSFETPLLNTEELSLLRQMAEAINARLGSEPDVVNGVDGPWDIELGFRDGRIWLFQVSPYGENRQSRANDYLRRLDPPEPQNRSISLTMPLP